MLGPTNMALSVLLLLAYVVSSDAFLLGMHCARLRSTPAQISRGPARALLSRAWVHRKRGGAATLRCQEDPGARQGSVGARQGSLPNKGPDPLAPYCTESEAIFTGEYYNSADGTKVMPFADLLLYCTGCALV
jgi:hypothetical protein